MQGSRKPDYPPVYPLASDGITVGADPTPTVTERPVVWPVEPVSGPRVTSRTLPIRDLSAPRPVRASQRVGNASVRGSLANLVDAVPGWVRVMLFLVLVCAFSAVLMVFLAFSVHVGPYLTLLAAAVVSGILVVAVNLARTQARRQ